jgi:hypothetical protein
MIDYGRCMVLWKVCILCIQSFTLDACHRPGGSSLGTEPTSRHYSVKPILRSVLGRPRKKRPFLRGVWTVPVRRTSKTAAAPVRDHRCSAFFPNFFLSFHLSEERSASNHSKNR